MRISFSLEKCCAGLLSGLMGATERCKGRRAAPDFETGAALGGTDDGAGRLPVGHFAKPVVANGIGFVGCDVTTADRPRRNIRRVAQQLVNSQLVYARSSSDLDRLGLVIEFVEAALINCSPQLESSAIRRAIIWIFQQERAALLAQSKAFDVPA